MNKKNIENYIEELYWRIIFKMEEDIACENEVFYKNIIENLSLILWNCSKIEETENMQHQKVL